MHRAPHALRVLRRISADLLQGYSAIAALVKQAAGRIVVMAGGGVRSENVLELVANTGVQEVHSSARR